MTALHSRKPWAAALIGLLFGPVACMLFVNRGRAAVSYALVLLLGGGLPFLLAHFDILHGDPRSVAVYVIMGIQVVSALDGYRSVPLIQGPMHFYSQGYAILCIAYVLPMLVVTLFRGYLFDYAQVSNESMEPVIPMGSVVLIDRHAYLAANPARGDIVFLKARKRKESIENISDVRRVVGLPGEKITLIGDDISIDNLPIPQSLKDQMTGGNESFEEDLPGGKSIVIEQNRNAAIQIQDGLQNIQIPSNAYFVVGDNRSMSEDSRNGLGTVAFDQVEGKVTAIVWNIHSFHFSYARVE